MTTALLKELGEATQGVRGERSPVASPGIVSSTTTLPPAWRSGPSGDVLWIDQARSVAALGVVILHVSAGVVWGVSDFTSFAWWVGNILDAAVRWCVPVFVMITGTLLLDFEQPMGSFSTFYFRRAARLCWPLFFWSALYLIWNGARDYLKSGHVNVDTLVGMLLAGQPHYHLWYLYMLLGLYFSAPFVRVLLQHLDVEQTLALCFSVFVFAFASALHHHVAGAAKGPFILWFLPYLSYFMAGGILRRWKSSIDTRRIVIILISSVALTAIGCHVVAVRRDLPSGLYFYDYFSVTVIPMALAVFLLLRNAPAMRILVELAPLSLGVYLVHPLFLECISRLGFEEWRFNPVWAIPIKVLLILLLSLSAVWAIRRIPVLRRVV